MTTAMATATPPTAAPAAPYAPAAAPPAAVDDAFRARVLRALGAGDAAVDELLAYGRNAFAREPLPRLPLADEAFVPCWARYVEEARTSGSVDVLRRHLVQLRFPVADEVRESDAYRAATLRGDASRAPGPDAWPRFADPDGVRLLLHPTAAGAIPVIVATARADFELLVRALAHRNAPVPVPASMGALIVSGYNNWDRVAEARRAWAAARGGDADDAWRAEFARLVPQKARYQDRFVLLSVGPYSATPAAALGLDADAWRARSLTIRLEHECAHYLTRRVLGSMRNALHDELIADYAGIVAAEGRFRADWLLRFMGQEAHPRFRDGGRLANYRGDPPLSDAAFAVLRELVVRAAVAIERFDAARPRGTFARRHDTAHVIVALARLALEELAVGDGAERLARAHAAVVAEAGDA